MKKHLYSTIGILLTVFFTTVHAQPGPPEDFPAIARLEQYKKVRLLEVLRLDEETSARFVSRYNKMQQETRELMDKRRELVNELEQKLRKRANEKEIAQLNEDIFLCSEKLVEVRSKYMRGLQDLLTQEQIAEYLVFEQRFSENVRDIMRQLARDRWGGRKPR